MRAHSPRMPKHVETTHDSAGRQGAGSVQRLADASPHVSRLNAIQDTASQSPRVQRLVQMKAMLQSPPVQRMPEPQGSAPIQMMRVVRWMDADKRSDYISKLAANQPEAYARVQRGLAGGGRGQLLQEIDRHGQGMLGDNTPFVSVAINPYSLSWGSDDSESGVDDILRGAPHDVWFDVPDEYLYPGSTGLSQSETELLVLLPPGVSLQQYIATQDLGGGEQPLIEDNRWKGMSTRARRAALQQMNPEFTKLAVRGSREGEEGSFAVKQEVVPPPWEVAAQDHPALVFSALPRNIQAQVVDLAAGNWGGGDAAFRRGLGEGQAWAREYLASTLRDNDAAIRRAMSSQRT